MQTFSSQFQVIKPTVKTNLQGPQGHHDPSCATYSGIVLLKEQQAANMICRQKNEHTKIIMKSFIPFSDSLKKFDANFRLTKQIIGIHRKNIHLAQRSSILPELCISD